MHDGIAVHRQSAASAYDTIKVHIVATGRVDPNCTAVVVEGSAKSQVAGVGTDLKCIVAVADDVEVDDMTGG